MVRKRLCLVLGAAALCLAATPALGAMINNGGFESGLTGWTVVTGPQSSVSVVTNHLNSSGSPASWGPQEGTHFALLKSDGQFSPTLVYQPFTASQGDVLTLSYFFDAQGSSTDTAGGFLYGPGTPIPLFLVSSNSDVGWVPVTYTFAAPGDYSLAFQMQKNSLTIGNASYLGIDAVSVVPLPAAVVLGFLGLSMAGLKLRQYA